MNNAVLAQRYQRATLVCILVLLVVLAIDTLIAPTQGRAPNVVVWLFVSVPLVIFVPGIWRGGIYSCAWLSFVSLLYFAQGVTALFAPDRRALDIAHLLLAIALFVCALLAVRYTARAKRVAS